MPSSAYVPSKGQLTQICACSTTPIPISASCPVNQKNSPVLLDSGLVSFSIPLLSAAAVGSGGFSFVLNYYNDPSTTGSDGAGVGVGFNYAQNALLTPFGDDVLLQLGENTQELFVNIGGGAYSSANNNTAATLTRSGSGTPADQFTLVSRGGVVSSWLGFYSSIATPGRMTRFQDRFGNLQTFNWGVLGCSAVRLLGLTDSYGRPVTFSYWGPEFNYALQQVTDFLGRQVNLFFDSSNRLISLVGPAVTRGAGNNANVFPGLAWAFKYDSTNPRIARQNDIIAIYRPNQVAPYLSAARTVDVAAVYADAMAREQFAYHQDPTDGPQFGKVQQYTESASGSSSVGSGAYGYLYVTTGLPANLANPADVIVSRTIVTDRMGNQTASDIGASGMIAHVEAFATRSKNSLEASEWETWFAWNSHNQNTLTVYPERNCIVRTYEDETTVPVIGGAPYAARIGLPRTVTELPGNPIGLTPTRLGSNGQTQLVTATFFDPIFCQPCATIEARANPIDISGDYFVPQNDGTTPTDVDKSRYATITFFDFQKDFITDGVNGVADDAALQALLFPETPSGTAAANIETLIAYVNTQMSATDGSGGIPSGFSMNLGDINGDGTGNGDSSGLPNATHLGNVVKIQRPSVLQLLPGGYPPVVLADGPLAYWRLGDLSGTTAADNSGNGYAGTYSGDYTLAQPPLTAAGAAARFGSGTGLMQANPPNPATAITVECWLRTSTTQVDGGLVARWDVQNSWVLHASATAIYFSILPSSLVEVTAGFAFNVADGNTHHLAGTYDSTSGAVSIYLDGALVGSATASGTLQPSTQNVTVANYGLTGGSPASYFTGELQEAAVYPTALSAGRILAHYNAGPVPWASNTQERIELFTSNLLGQNTTRTDAEGNVNVTVRFPQNDPEGAAQYLVPTLSNKQYGFVKEVHVDADPATVMTLLGPDADLVAFTGNIIPRTNTPGVYQNLVTRYQPSGTGSGCSGCAYDPLGNPLSVTDPRNHTTTYERNELGEPYRVTSPAPYNYPVETWFDANRNTVRVDTQDVIVKYTTNDPGDPAYARFVPTGLGSTANLPTMPGPGGSVRPGWFSNLYTFDLLDNKIEEDIDATGSSPASLVTTRAFDFNQNLVKITKPLGNTIEFDWDERNLKIAIRIGGPTGSVIIMAYDGNKNLTDVIGPATRGTPAQTLSAVIGDAFGGSASVTFSGDWLVENLYDGFDRKITATDAAGGMVLNTFDPGARTIATQFLGSPGGPTPTDRSGSSNVLLASGEARFDEAGRQYEAQRDVFLDGGTYYAGIAGKLPSGRTVTHTGGGLAANSTANNHTGTVTLTAGGTSYVLQRTVFDRADRVTATAADNGAITTIALDGAGRQMAVADALGNVLQRQFDPNGNVVFATLIEKCTISTSIATESFSAAMAYDVLDRMIVGMAQGPDGSLNTNWAACCTWPVLPPTLFTFMGFDSRDNRTNLVDSKLNTTVWELDGASRQLREKRHLRTGGDGYGPIYATVLTQFAFDANSNLIRLVDNNGGITAWLYDLLDRNTIMQFHDGSTRTNVLNAADDIVGYTDENGSAFANIFDVLGRRTDVAITPALGVAGNPAPMGTPAGTLAQAFQFDGLGRVTFSRDSVGTLGVGGLTNADVGATYDSINRMLEEQQTYAGDTRYVTHNAWTSFPATGFTFPSSRQLTVAFDALYRKNAINEASGGASIAAWQFFGARIATVTLGNSTVTSFMNNGQTRSAIQLGQATPPWGSISTDQLGYDGSGRAIGKRHFNSGSVLVGFTTAFDPASNKLFERALHAENRSALYANDSMDRLTQYQRGVLATGGGSITTPITLPNTDSQRLYTLDALGNWTNTSFTPVASPPGLDVRTHNKLNQITAFDAPSAPTPVRYDHGNNTGSAAARGNGNIINDGTRANAFDALNRMVAVNRTSDGALIGAYVYDAISRRILRAVSYGGVTGTLPNSTSRYLLDGQRIVEELNGATGVAVVQYVWGQYVDELIQLKALTAIGPQPLSAGNYYLLSDLLYRSAALTNSTGGIVEAFDTDAYGNTLPFSGPGTDGLWFTDDDAQAVYSACRYVFMGREYDAETQTYYFRMRRYLPVFGRFASRDKARHRITGPNRYELCFGNPVVLLDPLGLQAIPGVAVEALKQGGKLIIGEEMAGLGPEDPVADAAAIGTGIATLAYATYLVVDAATDTSTAPGDGTCPPGGGDAPPDEEKCPCEPEATKVETRATVVRLLMKEGWEGHPEPFPDHESAARNQMEFGYERHLNYLKRFNQGVTKADHLKEVRQPCEGLRNAIVALQFWFSVCQPPIPPVCQAALRHGNQTFNKYCTQFRPLDGPLKGP